MATIWDKAWKTTKKIGNNALNSAKEATGYNTAKNIKEYAEGKKDWKGLIRDEHNRVTGLVDEATDITDDAVDVVHDAVEDIPVLGWSADIYKDMYDSAESRIEDIVNLDVGGLANDTRAGVENKANLLVGNDPEYKYNNGRGLGEKQFGENDAFGPSSEEIMKEYANRINSAVKDANDIVDANKRRLLTATKRDDGSKRTISSSLNDYDLANERIGNQYAKNRDAISANTQNNLNNFQSFTSPVVAAQAGTSAASRLVNPSSSVNTAMNNVSSNQWDTSALQSLNNSKFNTSNLNTQQGVSENVLTNDAMPQQDFLNMNQDWATNNLQTQVQLANGVANIMDNDNGVVGEFLKYLN